MGFLTLVFGLCVLFVLLRLIGGRGCFYWLLWMGFGVLVMWVVLMVFHGSLPLKVSL